jgi:hypothetical protein
MMVNKKELRKNKNISAPFTSPALQMEQGQI